MRVSIWDVDWYYKTSFLPNYKAQKISSFHKQQGHLINFIEDSYHIDFDYDIIYIIRENKNTPMIPFKFLDNRDAKLIGREFMFYDNYYELDSVIEMVRPDYSLYEVPERNAYANAHVLKLLHKTEPLPTRQDHHNSAAKYHKKTLVVDEYLWDTTDEILIKCLKELKQYKNIAFKETIKLKKIFSNDYIKKLFSELHFAPGTYFKFRNDYGSEFEEVKEIIDLIVKIKENSPNVYISPFPVKAVLYDHRADKENGIKDLERVLKITDYAKEQKVNLIIKTPNNRDLTPYWYFFDMLEIWTTDYFRTSYVESMLSTRMLKTNEQWHEIINDPIKWSTPRSRFLVHLLTEYPSIILQYGMRRWGDEKLDKNWIDKESILKSRNIFERESIYKKLTKEFMEELK